MSIQIFYENFHTRHVLTSLSCTHAWPTTPLEALLLLLPLCPLLYHHVIERFDALTIDHHWSLVHFHETSTLPTQDYTQRS